VQLSSSSAVPKFFGLGEASFGLVAEGGRFSGHGTPRGRFAQIDERTADRLGVAVSAMTE
jgi:NADPH:quinone reductase